MKLEKILKSIKASLLVGALSLVVGCASSNTNRPILDTQEKKSSYFSECSEKLWLGVTSPFMAAAGLVSYQYTCRTHHTHRIECEMIGGNLPVRIISGAALIGEGAYNLVAAPFPLPSAGPLMKKTVIWAQDTISNDSERHKNWFVRFYTPYGDFYSPYDEVKPSKERIEKYEKWKRDFYEYYKEKIPGDKLLESLKRLPPTP